jgi:5-(carboxyamino)imidazole ribonucleotide synthase
MQKKIGVLGGGQLGRMLLQAAISYPFEIHILDPDPEAPCRAYCSHFQQGNLQDFDRVYHFGKNMDILTIEIEHVNVDALERLEQEGVQVHPSSQSIRIIQDKRIQKQFFKSHEIPTAPFVLINQPEALSEHLDMLPAFQKLGKEGYDGRGVQALRSADDFHKAFAAPSLLEKKIDFVKELAVIVARNPQGEVRCFPPVEMVFDPKLNLVDYLLAPAQIDEATAQAATALAEKVIQAFQMVGLLAVEMFLTAQGELLVNEVAPRTHNSGHHSIEGNYTSQFEQHLRAIAALPLGCTDSKGYAAMVNLLGAEGHQGPARYEGLEALLGIKGAYIHLYGKKITKPGRKMGHITLIDEELSALQEKIALVKREVRVKS